MSDGIVPKTCNKKASKRTEDESQAHKKIKKLSEKQNNFWAKYRRTELPKRVQSKAQKARATETLVVKVLVLNFYKINLCGINGSPPVELPTSGSSRKGNVSTRPIAEHDDLKVSTQVEHC